MSVLPNWQERIRAALVRYRRMPHRPSLHARARVSWRDKNVLRAPLKIMTYKNIHTYARVYYRDGNGIYLYIKSKFHFQYVQSGMDRPHHYIKK